MVGTRYFAFASNSWYSIWYHNYGRTWSITSLPGFSPKASGFYPFGDATDLVRGWRRDCVVGGMETHFQWRKAHSRTAKCEAFHFAPRLFFMFLFFVPIHVHNLSPAFINWPHQIGRLWAEKAESTARERKCVIISHLHIGKKKNHHKNEKKRQFDSDNYFFFINLGH